MENRNSSLWIGLGVGSVIGALAYRFSRTSKAKKLKEKVCDTFINNRPGGRHVG
ncbi:hypothetical protein BvMPK_1060 [Phocaeicola vulgatus]|uniref:YtxH domain-containing protein n=1 Tax=Phocaeicola vulgatus TaxID=821 RepID=A0A0P0M1L4_PHOVU|nr:hypothetical protein BvMPK_1060 [Phocaeicola vulgatus]